MGTIMITDGVADIMDRDADIPPEVLLDRIADSSGSGVPGVMERCDARPVGVRGAILDALHGPDGEVAAATVRSVAFLLLSMDSMHRCMYGDGGLRRIPSLLRGETSVPFSRMIRAGVSRLSKDGPAAVPAVMMETLTKEERPMFEDSGEYGVSQPGHRLDAAEAARAFLLIPDAYLALVGVRDGGAPPLRDRLGTVARVLPDIDQTLKVACAMATGLDRHPDDDDVLTALAFSGGVTPGLFGALRSAGGVRAVPDVLILARRYGGKTARLPADLIVEPLLHDYRHGYMPTMAEAAAAVSAWLYMGGMPWVTSVPSLLYSRPSWYGTDGDAEAAGLTFHVVDTLIGAVMPSGTEDDGSVTARTRAMALDALPGARAWVRMSPLLERLDHGRFSAMLMDPDRPETMARAVIEALPLMDDGIPVSMIEESLAADIERAGRTGGDGRTS